jgi:signal transduction histidine kinase
MKAVLDASGDGAVVLDQDRRILYYNQAYQAASGLRGRQLAQVVADGAHCYEILPLEICEKGCLGCQARDASRWLRLDEIRTLERESTTDKTFNVTALPLPGGMIVEMYRDVTADVAVQRKYRVMLDAERRAKAVLEETVEARTTELRNANEELKRTQAQLIHQEKMSSLGRLVAGIAHELNNPINFVYGNVDFLGKYLDDLLALVAAYEAEAKTLPEDSQARLVALRGDIEYDFLVEDAKKLIRSIRSGAERTAGIVRDLKAFSRTGGGELSEVDLLVGIETTLNLITPLLKNRIVAHRDYATTIPRVVGHAGHLNQVFMNILTNAAQAINGEGNIWVRVAPDETGEAVVVVIRDDGPGIPPDIVEKIFDPFFTTKQVGEGTGLGLAISESIIRAHGGSLRYISKGRTGAEFIVRLPVRGSRAA